MEVHLPLLFLLSHVLIVSRPPGQCLNFTSSWVLVLMLRRTLTSLRERGVVGALLDRHVSLHKLAALTLIAHAALHSVMHFCNFGKSHAKNNYK